MGTTTKLAIPYIEPTDIVADYPAADKAKADRIEAIWFSSWTAFTSSVTGLSRYRVVGSVVFVQVDGTVTTQTGVESILSTAPLPSGVRPVGGIARSSGMFNAGYMGALYVDTGGNVKALQATGANRTSVSGTVIYPI